MNFLWVCMRSFGTVCVDCVCASKNDAFCVGVNFITCIADSGRIRICIWKYSTVQSSFEYAQVAKSFKLENIV
jgi:hypothetical protein